MPCRNRLTRPASRLSRRIAAALTPGRRWVTWPEAMVCAMLYADGLDVL
jgi:hypothetical protein